MISSLVKLNLARLRREGTPMILGIVGPVLAVLLLSLAIGGGQQGLSVGAYAPAKSDLSAQVLTALSDNGMSVTEMTNSSDCVDSVRTGKHHVCLLFSQPFGVFAENNTVTIVLDSTNIPLAGSVAGVVEAGIENRSFELSLNITKQLVSALDEVRQRIADSKSGLVKLSTAQDNAMRSLANGKQSSESVVLPISLVNVSMDTLQQNADGSKNDTLSAINAIIPRLLEASVELENVSLAIASLNVTAAEREYAEDLISNVSGRVNASLTAAVNLNNSFNASRAVFDSAFGIISNEVTLAKDKISLANSNSEFTIQQMGVVEKYLNDALVQVVAVQRSLDAIESIAGSIPTTDASRVSRPIRVNLQPLPSPSRFSGAFPALLVLIVAISGLLISPRLVRLELEGSRHRAALAPEGRERLAIASVLTSLGIVAIQSVLIVVIAALLGAISAPFSSLLAILISGSVFVLLGVALSLFFSKEETALFAALSLGVLFIALSGIIFPVEQMHPVLAAIASYSPLLLAANVVRQVAVFGTPIWSASGVLVLLFTALVAAALAYLALLRGKVGRR